MAFIYPVKHQSGPTVNYWRLAHQTADFSTGQLTQIWLGYWTPEDRAAGCSEADRKVTYRPIPDGWIKLGYDAGRENAFGGAEDYLDDPWKSQPAESPAEGQP